MLKISFSNFKVLEVSIVEDCLWGETTYNEKYGFSMPKRFDAIQVEEICRTDDELKQLKGK
jgi:hypothetical protein